MWISRHSWLHFSTSPSSLIAYTFRTRRVSSSLSACATAVANTPFCGKKTHWSLATAITTANRIASHRTASHHHHHHRASCQRRNNTPRLSDNPSRAMSPPTPLEYANTRTRYCNPSFHSKHRHLPFAPLKEAPPSSITPKMALTTMISKRAIRREDPRDTLLR